jgi:hypothetical protein
LAGREGEWQAAKEKSTELNLRARERKERDQAVEADVEELQRKRASSRPITPHQQFNPEVLVYTSDKSPEEMIREYTAVRKEPLSSHSLAMPIRDKDVNDQAKSHLDTVERSSVRWL